MTVETAGIIMVVFLFGLMILLMISIVTDLCDFGVDFKGMFRKVFRFLKEVYNMESRKCHVIIRIIRMIGKR